MLLQRQHVLLNKVVFKVIYLTLSTHPRTGSGCPVSRAGQFFFYAHFKMAAIYRDRLVSSKHETGRTVYQPMPLQKAKLLFSYLKTLSIGPAGVWNLIINVFEQRM